MQVRIINNITKEYPDMIKVLIYKSPHCFSNPCSPKRDREEVDANYTPQVSSLRRTKTLIQDIVLCNDFDLFCTFTFNPKYVDSTNFASCYHKMSIWLHHQKDKSTALKKKFIYLLVPERHKSGAWHFHALLGGYSGRLHDSGHTTSSLRSIYNITSFRSGFTTAVGIDSIEGVSSYITKYITKDFIKEFDKRRFFASRNLKRPTKSVNSGLFANTLPLFRQKISENRESELYIIRYKNDAQNLLDSFRSM